VCRESADQRESIVQGGEAKVHQYDVGGLQVPECRVAVGGHPHLVPGAFQNAAPQLGLYGIVFRDQDAGH